MGLWPFGRGGGDVEFVTRVVSAVAGDGVRLRGRLTLHFASPRPSDQAEHAGDLAALTASELFADTFDHKRLLGEEAAIAGKVRNRLPDTFPPLRSLELVALHIVAQGGDRRPSVGRLQVVGPVARAPHEKEGRFSLQVPKNARRDSAPSLPLPDASEKPDRPGAVTRRGLGPPEADGPADSAPVSPTKTAVGKVDLKPAASRPTAEAGPERKPAEPTRDAKPAGDAKPAEPSAVEPKLDPRPEPIEIRPPKPASPIAPKRRRSSVKIPRAPSRPRIAAMEPAAPPRADDKPLARAGRDAGRSDAERADAGCAPREVAPAAARAAAPRRRSDPKRPSVRPDPRRDDDSSPPRPEETRASEPPRGARKRDELRPNALVPEGGVRDDGPAPAHRDFSAPKPKGGLLSRALDETVQPGAGPAGTPERPRPAPPAAAKDAAEGKRGRRRTPRWRRRLEALGERATLEAVGAPVASLLRDVAARLLLAVLLAQEPDSFDLVLVLHRPDDATDDPEDVALARMGLEQLARETGAAAAHVLYAALLDGGVPHNIAIETLQDMCKASLPCGKLPVAELGRYLGTRDLVAELGRAVADALGVAQSEALSEAVSPLIDAARDELRIAADYVRRASGL